jgi:hypothetical protein
MSKPIEEYPRNLIPLDYWPPPGIKHPVKTGERWESIAAQYGVDVKVLIYHNFKTTRSNEVNWYLRHLIGCKFSTDGLNWAFTSGLNPGYIMVPPPTINKTITMDPEVYTAPESEIKRLKPIVKNMPGLVGQRIRCLLALAERVGSPLDEKLWYYSSQPTLHYTELRTTNQWRRGMTEATQGRLPFDGHAGAAYGYWRTYPFRQLKIDCINGCSDAVLKHKMELIEEDFRKSFYYVARVGNATTQGGGSSYGPLVAEFVSHVHALSQSPIHLYSCGGIGPKQFYWFPQ